ncbi:MAG: hypothetical protein ACO3JL_01720 [Myxococcota bacterium]
MPPRHLTPATIPRFQEHQGVEGLEPATAEAALSHFSIALRLRMVDVQGVREWARTFTRRRSRVPEWVWAVLEPGVAVSEVIERERPFAELALRGDIIIPKLQEAVAGGHIDVFEAGRYIYDLRLGPVPRTGYTEAIDEYNRSLEEFMGAWVREEFFRRTGEPRLSPEETPDLDGPFARFARSFVKLSLHYQLQW